MSEIIYQRHPMWEVLNEGDPYQPFPWQAEHIHSAPDTRFIIVGCGRRAGKTTSMTAETVREAFRPSTQAFGKTHYPLIYVVGPTAELSMKVWQPIWDLFVPDDKSDQVPPLGNFYKNHDKTRRIIWLNNGAVIQGKSADDPKSLQGDRVTCAIVDEAHDMPDEAWQYLLPALLDSGGRLRAIGVTKGKNRFRSMWERGQAGEKGYYSFSVPSTAHPLIFETEAEAEEARLRGGDWVNAVSLETDETYLSLTDIEQKQMFWAEWVEQDGQVFSDLDRCFTGDWVEVENAKGVNIMGLDIAKLHDYTVAYVGDIREQRLIARDRFNGLDYTVAVPRIASMYREYKCRYIHMDVSGVGEPVADMLRAEGCSIIPFKFTNDSKAGLINTLAREVERGNIILPRHDAELKREMELYEATIRPSGVIGYSAPPGYYDDCVIAAALANAKMVRGKRMAKSPNGKPYASWSSESTRANMPPLPRPKEENEEEEEAA